MKRWMIGLVALGAICLGGAATASAQGYGSPHGSYYSPYNSGYRVPAGYGGRSAGYGVSRWHDTSHYDYHRPSIQRHGFHFHVAPGHYDYHRSGHRDY